jgi:hypothetical protein
VQHIYFAQAIVACLCLLEPKCLEKRDELLRPFREMVKFQLDLGFPMEVVRKHLGGGDDGGASTKDGGADDTDKGKLKYDYRKRKYVMKKKKKPAVLQNPAAEFLDFGLTRYCGSGGFWYIGKVEPPAEQKQLPFQLRKVGGRPRSRTARDAEA